MSSPFSDKLITLRTDRKLSQKDSAEALGVSISRYNKWENNSNRPDYETVCHIANHYGVTTDYLLGRTDVKNPAHQEMIDIAKVSEKIIEVLTSKELNIITDEDYAPNNIGGEDVRTLKYILELIISSPHLFNFLSYIKLRTSPSKHITGAQWGDETIEWHYHPDNNLLTEVDFRDAAYTQKIHELLDKIIFDVGDTSAKRWAATHKENVAKAREIKRKREEAARESQDDEQ